MYIVVNFIPFFFTTGSKFLKNKKYGIPHYVLHQKGCLPQAYSILLSRLISRN